MRAQAVGGDSGDGGRGGLMELVSGVIDSTKTFPNPKYGVEICVFIGSSLYNSSPFSVSQYFLAPNVSIFSHGLLKIFSLSPNYFFFSISSCYFPYSFCASIIPSLTLHLHLVTSLFHSSLFPPFPLFSALLFPPISRVPEVSPYPLRTVH